MRGREERCLAGQVEKGKIFRRREYAEKERRDILEWGFLAR